MTVVSAGVWGGNANLGDLGSALPNLGGGVHGFLDNAAGFLSGSGLSGDSLTAAIGATRVLVHGVVAGALTVAQGGHFLNGFAIGAAGEAGSVGMQAAGLTNTSDYEVRFARAFVAGALGGTASVLTGGKFANGATTAAFAELYNGLSGRSRDYCIERCTQLVLEDPDIYDKSTEFDRCVNTCMGAKGAEWPQWKPYFEFSSDPQQVPSTPAPQNPPSSFWNTLGTAIATTALAISVLVFH